MYAGPSNSFICWKNGIVDHARGTNLVYIHTYQLLLIRSKSGYPDLFMMSTGMAEMYSSATIFSPLRKRRWLTDPSSEVTISYIHTFMNNNTWIYSHRYIWITTMYVYMYLYYNTMYVYTCVYITMYVCVHALTGELVLTSPPRSSMYCCSGRHNLSGWLPSRKATSEPWRSLMNRFIAVKTTHIDNLSMYVRMYIYVIESRSIEYVCMYVRMYVNVSGVSCYCTDAYPGQWSPGLWPWQQRFPRWFYRACRTFAWTQ